MTSESERLDDNEFAIQIIQLLLGLIDALERKYGLSPRTKQYRDAGKRVLKQG